MLHCPPRSFDLPSPIADNRNPTRTSLGRPGIYFIFGQSYAIAIGQDFNLLVTYLIGIITTSGILEAVVGTIIALFVCKPLLTYTKRGS